MNGILIAGTASGVGKTTVALGLMNAFRRKGLRVQPFKVGPDFIDPGYHTLVTGLPSRNLDGWMLPADKVQETFSRHASQCDLAIVEGVMGLFDGLDGRSEEGSTAQIAKLLNLPVILVVDARAMARSVGAMVYGFENYDPKLNVAGVIFNRVGSPRHYEYLQEAVANRCKAQVLGYLSRHEALQLPERHLGLVTAGESGLTENFMNSLSHEIEHNVNINKIESLFSVDVRSPERSDTSHPAFNQSEDQALPVRARGVGASEDQQFVLPHGPPHLNIRLAVARDEAFCFYYPDNLDLLAELGVELCYFSPMRDSSLPQNVDGIYLGGGYPELYAKQLTANQTLRRQVKAVAEKGLPIYAECGGLMYLTRAIRDPEGCAYEMVGLFPTEARMLKKRKALGYVEVYLTSDCLLGEKGMTLRGHEYHYSELSHDLLQEEKKSEPLALPGRAPDQASGSASDWAGHGGIASEAEQAPIENRLGASEDQHLVLPHGPPQIIEGVYELIIRRDKTSRREGYSYRNVLASYVHLHFGSHPKVAESLVHHLRQWRNVR